MRLVYSLSLSLLLLVSSYSFSATPDRITRAIDSSQVVQLTRSLHPKAQPQYDQGAVDPQFQFSYVTLLTSPSASQQRALNKLLAEQQDPASPNYHKWLTPEQYGERFGLSLTDLNKITAWLKGQGFTVLSVAPGRNSIIVSGSAAQFESAFQTEFHHYLVKGESHIANATPLKIPAAWSGVLTGVRGLNDFRMKPMSVRKRLHPGYYDGIFLFPDFVAPGDIATIYDINPLYHASTPIDGTGQKLAVVGQTDIYLADINDFRSGFGLTQISSCTTNASLVITACNSSNFQYIHDPLVTDPGLPNTCGDLSEADLDIEWAGATARNAQIVYVNSPATFDSTCTTSTNNGGVENALSYAIQHNVAPVVSMSYGICELYAVDHETELAQANTQGMTIVNSTADTGAAGCDGFTNSTTTPPNLAVNGLAVSYPASSQYVTAAGGTEVPFNDFTGTFWSTTNGTDGGSALGYVPEEAWNDDYEFAAFCAANKTNTFCTGNNITSQATAQAAIGLGSGGGGASNCFTETAQGVCTGGFPQPPWQTVTIAGQNTRLTPDVSLLASPNFPGFILCTPLSEIGLTGTASSCAPGGAAGIANALALTDSSGNPFPSVIGGTSVAAPTVAGMIALLNQYLGNANGMGNANPMLYRLAAVAPAAFHDITAGNNIESCKPGTPTTQTAEPAIRCPAAGTLGYSAGIGYDLATGLGSVDFNNLAIAWKTPPDFTVGSSGGISVFAGQSGTATVTVNPINNFGQAVAFSCSGLPTGASCLFNPATATPPGTTTSVMTVQTTGTETAGTGSFAVVATAGVLSQLSRTTSESLTVQEPDFTWSGSGSHTILAGQMTPSYSFTATSSAPSAFADTVQLSCTGLPDATAACVFSPSSIAAGTSGATPISLTITTKGPNTGTGAAVGHRAHQRSPWLPLTLPIAGMVMVGLAGRRLSKYSVGAGLCVLLALLALLIACGGGGSSPVTVSVMPSSVSLYPNVAGANGWPPQTQAFTATVDNTANTGVRWSVSPGGGSIDSSGNYTAPATVPSPATVTVTATSQADSSKSGTATVNIQTPTKLGTFTVTVTATEGLRVHSQTVTLIVQ